MTAGMWPAEGIYVYALDAATGAQIWCNDSSGDMYMDLPHGGASAFTGVAPQGYLLASGDILLVPTGRSVPAAFDRRTGRLLYYQPAATQWSGGAWVTIAGDLFFNPKHVRGAGPAEHAGAGATSLRLRPRSVAPACPQKTSHGGSRCTRNFPCSYKRRVDKPIESMYTEHGRSAI